MKKALVLISLLFGLTVSAATLNDVTMEDSHGTLTLNGLGTRKATFLKVKVYVGGLYLSKKTNDAKEAQDLPNPKFIRMHFVRDVSAEKLRDGWKESFAAAHGKEGEAKFPAFQEFLGALEDVEKGDEVLLNFTDKGIEVTVKGKAKGTIGDAAFAKALFAVWFVNPIDEGLRDGLLGK
jgi:hypothetical protein